jgi:predicted nucleic acid-binding protein
MADGERPVQPPLVLDASAMVDLLLDTESAPAVRRTLGGRRLAAPAHFDAEVMSAIGRLARSGALSEEAATVRIERLAAAPIERHPLDRLLMGAWARRDDTRLVDALYLELAAALDTVVLTTDRRLARAHPSSTVLPDAR